MYELHKDIPYEKFELSYTAPAFKRKWLCMETGGVPNDSCRTIGMPTLDGERSKHQCKEKHVYEEEKKYEGLWRRIERRKQEKEQKKRSTEDSFFNPDIPSESEVPKGIPIPPDHFAPAPQKQKEPRQAVPIDLAPSQGDYP